LGVVFSLVAAAAVMLGAGLRSAHARLTETLPKSTFMLDVAYNHSWLQHAYDNNGQKTELIDRIYRYEPGGGMQGIIIPNASVTYQITVLQLQYGVLDNLSVGVGLPIVVQSKVDPRLGWVEGDYHWWLGRQYSEEDFWDWADSMGQRRPGTWRGNQGALSDMIVGARYRFSDHISGLEERGWGLALSVYGALPTGQPKDPELLVAAGTTSWDLHFQGELGFHLTADKVIEATGDRLIVGGDIFYEVFFKRRYDSAKGTVNPLIQTHEPYTGDTYTLDPGDFLGFRAQAYVVAIKGPIKNTWLTRKVEDKESLPPLLTFGIGYSFTWLYQSDWESDSSLWDWTQEKLWRPGYKNRLYFDMTLSFLRLGIPAQVYLGYKNLSWIPGKNCRAADVVSVGVRGPMKFW
jgi:hypothetical protein